MAISCFSRLFLLSLFLHTSLQAQIENVTIKWTALLCQQSCVRQLEQQFRNINGVANIEIDQAQGQASIIWKPDVPLTFVPINNAMSMIGLSISDFTVRVRGTISHDEYSTTLNSIGDGTRFLLQSPTTPKRFEMVEEFNPVTHSLKPNLRDQFLKAEKERSVVIVEGMIFQPERSPPLQLVVQRVQVIKQNEKERENP